MGLSAALADSITQPLSKFKDYSLSVVYTVETSAYTDDYQKHLSDLLFQDSCVCHMRVLYSNEIILLYV